ncbi:hypothetical protein GH733_005504 [Mirounga leonina]|nr:hypothetical protein GH733_005504 [Mirounga leonina]
MEETGRAGALLRKAMRRATKRRARRRKSSAGQHLIEDSSDAKSWVFHLKLKGDYTTYLAEVVTSEDQNHIINLAQSAYQEAIDISKEITNSPEEAVSLANTTFDEAMVDLHTLTKDSYKDCTFIMQ